MKPEIPCKRCITFPVCKSQAMETSKMYVTQYILIELSRKCYMMEDYLTIMKYKTKKDIVALFGLKEDDAAPYIYMS